MPTLTYTYITYTHLKKIQLLGTLTNIEYLMLMRTRAREVRELGEQKGWILATGQSQTFDITLDKVLRSLDPRVYTWRKDSELA